MYKIACISSSQNEKAFALYNSLRASQSFNDVLFIEQLSGIQYLINVDVLIVLSGDGFVLRVLHELIKSGNSNVKVYGVNCGTLGFLLNKLDINSHDIASTIMDRIVNAHSVKLHPLSIELITKDKVVHKLIAINEISLIRQTYKTIHISLVVDGVTRIDDLAGDGVLLSTSAGSAAYNYSVGGSILPINSGLVSLAAINSFRPRTWKSAIIRDDSIVEFKLNDTSQRPALACADFGQFYSVHYVRSFVNKDLSFELLFDESSHIDNKIINEQFLTNC